MRAHVARDHDATQVSEAMGAGGGGARRAVRRGRNGAA